MHRANDRQRFGARDLGVDIGDVTRGPEMRLRDTPMPAFALARGRASQRLNWPLTDT
jgi:hypothetical protein